MVLKAKTWWWLAATTTALVLVLVVASERRRRRSSSNSMSWRALFRVLCRAAPATAGMAVAAVVWTTVVVSAVAMVETTPPT